MTRYVLDDFDFRVSTETLLERCHADPDEEEGARVLELFAEAMRIGRPKALVCEVGVEPLEGNSVRVGGVVVDSAFVREKLSQAPVAFAYVATSGREIEDWSAGLEDLVDRFYMDELKKLWLGCAMGALRESVARQFAPGVTLSSLNPGSLPMWPIEGQRELFRMLGDVEGAIGVRLTDSCLMLPAKSGSGILFPDRTGHVNCALCPRENCPNRRAPRRIEADNPQNP